MPGLHELNISLMKNGYFKVADVIEKHPCHEVLNNIRGKYVGINLDRAQIANMLSVDPNTKELPEEWDEDPELLQTGYRCFSVHIDSF